MKLLNLLPFVLFLAGFGCSSTPAPKAALRQYPMHGQVEKLDAAARVATIKHEKIGDWMDAMTMDFPVRDAAQFAKLKVGEKIAATVYVQDIDFWIGNIRVEPDAAPGGRKR